MPDIDPAALSRITPSTITPSAASKIPPPVSIPSSAKTSKASAVATRIDLEPVYTALKSAIGGEKWADYKDGIGLFLLGQFNQDELTARISPILSTPQAVHLHNQLLASIYGNVTRDLPDPPGVASWVAANDKPVPQGVSKVAGDANEQRLKTEVMNLPARERRRIKEVGREPEHYGGALALMASWTGGDGDILRGMLAEEKRARMIRLPDAGPASAGGVNKTNWELEIRKRYTQPLSSETGELPSISTLSSRITPICYEEGLTNGASSSVAHFLSVATSTYIKEILSSITSRSRSNVPNGIVTSAYRKELQNEEEKWLRGEVVKNSGGLLPVEQKVLTENKGLEMSDFSLGLEMGMGLLGSLPLVGQRVRLGWIDNEEELNAEEGGQVEDVEMDVDDAYGWEGGSSRDRKTLNGLLDGVLAGV